MGSYYKDFGNEKLISKRTKKVYPVQIKLDVFNFKKQTGASNADTASTFNTNYHSIIANWNRKFLEEENENLSGKSKGRPPTSKKRHTKQIHNCHERNS